MLRLAAAVLFLPNDGRAQRASGTVQTVRFMGANIYNNVFSAILMPMRMFKVQPAATSSPGSALRPGGREMRKAA